MKAQSEVYVRLQSIYKSKARKDVDEVLEILGSVPNGSQVEREVAETYCKNAAFVKLIRESVPDPERIKALAGKSLYSIAPSAMR